MVCITILRCTLSAPWPVSHTHLFNGSQSLSEGNRRIWTDEAQVTGLRIKFSVYNWLSLRKRPSSYILSCHFREENIWNDCSTEVILYRCYNKLYQRWPCVRKMFSWSSSSAGFSWFNRWQLTDSPLWSLQHCTPCLGSSRRAAYPWCHGPFGRRIRACWRDGAYSCQSQPSPSGSAGHFPPPGVCPESHTWTGRFWT